MPNENIKLTKFSHGAGCGCKISPAMLDDLLKSNIPSPPFPNLLIGNLAKDDAAAYDLGDGTSVLSTTDFFMPIVDDPFDFGRIAAANAISDIYAMGGKPLMAISIFGWPIDLLPSKIGQQVIEGGRKICHDANIPLAGGHSIDSPEPIFGLAVTGLIKNKFLKTNQNAKSDCQIFLTKSIGVGILSTALKQNKLSDLELKNLINSMTTLNQVGTQFAELETVTTMTDITGFGLLGHLIEVCESSNIKATIDYNKLPILDGVINHLKQGFLPGGTTRNFDSYGHKVNGLTTQEKKYIMCDPQTSGGLLVFVKNNSIDSFLKVAKQNKLILESIGFTQKLSTADKFVVDVI
jgi:selenide,water dikinase